MPQPGPDDTVLDTKDPNQVSSPRVLDIMLGSPIEQLFIFTGIAIPGFENRSPNRLGFGTWWVNLGRSPKQVISYTAVVGLASIHAGSDQGFILATDTVSVVLRDDTGELALVCDLAAKGDPAAVNRFSYQASVIVAVQDPLIAGVIRWPTSLATVLRQSNLFSAIGHTVISTPPTGGSLGSVVVHDVGHGGETDRPTFADGWFAVPYLLAGDLPMNTDITVAVSPVSGAFNLPPNVFSLTQVAGPRPVRLTPSSPQVFGVDFEMSLDSGPR